MYLSKVLVKCEQPRDLKKSLLFISTVSLKVNKALYLLVLAGTLRVFALFLKKRQLYLHECRDLTT